MAAANDGYRGSAEGAWTVSENKTTRYFTFGHDHMACVEFPRGGRLADYWVAVEAVDKHRDYFIEKFTTHFCPRPMQFAMEYDESNFKPKYFPLGELTRIVVPDDAHSRCT